MIRTRGWWHCEQDFTGPLSRGGIPYLEAMKMSIKIQPMENDVGIKELKGCASCCLQRDEPGTKRPKHVADK